MAQVNLNSTSTGAPRFPLASYKLRIMEEPAFKESRKGNDMLVFKLETVEPASMEIDGEMRELAGWEWTIWATYFENDNGKIVNPTLACIHKQLGFPEVFEINPETGCPEGISYAGCEIWVQGKSSTEQVLDEKRQPVINPVTNKPDTTESRRVIKVY